MFDDAKRQDSGFSRTEPELPGTSVSVPPSEARGDAVSHQVPVSPGSFGLDVLPGDYQTAPRTIGLDDQNHLTSILANTRRWRGHLLWKGPTNDSGYPRARAAGEIVGHRAVYALANGPIPSGMVVRHLCNLRHCLEPRHLAIGTHAENVADRVKAGRSARGEDNGRSKLTETDVLFIRARARAWGVIRTAEFFRIDSKAVRHILEGTNWAYLLEVSADRDAASAELRRRLATTASASLAPTPRAAGGGA